MNSTDYQYKAGRTMKDPAGMKIAGVNASLADYALGLAGESGEAVNKIKKLLFHDKGASKYEVAEELGDTLWYIAAICTNLGLDLNIIMRENIIKLETRYPTGYSHKASKERVDVIVDVE